MQDKNYDNFFDKKNEGESQQEKLMTMVEDVDKLVIEELVEGTVVTGKVVDIGKEFLFIDVGQKNEAVIKKMEFVDNENNITVKRGDILKAYIISIDDNGILMSKSLIGRKASIQELINAMKNKMPIDGKVTGVNKGGFNVTIAGRKAFCPFSNIDLKYVNEPNNYLSKIFQFVITRIENRGKNIVLSRLPLLEKHLEVKIDKFKEYIKENRIIKGTISRITEFGLFVDLGDIEGLVHISEVSWERSQDLDKSYKIGQIVECIVLKVEKGKPLRNSKISLSIRMTKDNPWENISKKIIVGDTMEGTITKLTKYGAFVQLISGIEGLIPISELSWAKRIRHPSEVVSERQKVKVSILAVDESKRSVSCSLKDISENPWNIFAEKYPVGSKVSGTASGITKYGFFIDLDKNITGLLLNGKVAKDKRQSIKKGDKIEVEIDKIDIDNCKVSLSCGGIEKTEENKKSLKREIAKQKTKAEEKSRSEFGDVLKAAFEKKK